MTVYVKDASKSVLSGLSKMKAAMIEDYAKFMVPDTDTKKKMNAAYADNFDIRYGKKYIKIVCTIVSLRLSLVLITTKSSRRVTF